MRLRLERHWYSHVATIGELYLDDLWECFTLEDVVRPGDIFQVKVPGKTAIPAGRYQMVLSWSGRFQARLPELLGVPNFTSIRIHAGNTEADTEGCILVGRARSHDAVYQSRATLTALLTRLEEGWAEGSMEIDIIDAPEPETVT